MIVLADPGRVRGAMHRRYVLLAKKLSLIPLLLLAAMSALAGGRSEDHAAAGSAAENGSIDYLGIAALMLKDGLLDRAESALEHVDPADEGLDKARYYTIRGLLRLQSAHYADAALDLQSAVRHGQLDPLINVYLAQAYFGAENYSAVLEALDAVPDLTRFPGLWALKAHSLWSLRQTGAAFECLEQAIRLFPERHGILKQRIVYLLELGLYQEAAAQSEEYLAKAGNDPEAFLAVGEALRRAGAVQEAVLILEMGAPSKQSAAVRRCCLTLRFIESIPPGSDQPAAPRISSVAAHDHDASHVHACEWEGGQRVDPRLLSAATGIPDQPDRSVRGAVVEIDRGGKGSLPFQVIGCLQA